MFNIRCNTISWLFFAFLVIKELLVGEAKIEHVRVRRGLKGSSLQRTTLSESDSENYSVAKNGRGLQDYPPCTYYYPIKKSKFNKYDDDWYDPCKTVESEYPTASPLQSIPYTRPPSMFFSTTPPVQLPLVGSNAGSDPPLEIVTEQVNPTAQRPIIRPTIGPTISPNNLKLIIAPSNSPVVSEETSIAVEIDNNVTIKEKGPSCLQAKSGRVVPTSINFTIHYKYELLAEREANMTDVVWPEVDRAFQRFLALALIDCDTDVEIDGASSIFRSKLKSISPEPIDSVGSLYPNGWSRNVSVDSNASSCTNIVIENKSLVKRELYCDVVTGSITLYLSEVSYMDTASDPSSIFLDYRNKVFKLLRDEINEGGEGISNYLDDSLGVRAFYLISESTNLNLKPISTVPDVSSNKLNPSGLKKEMSSSTPAIVGSLAVLVAFTIAAGAFTIRSKKNPLDEFDDTFKQNKTPRMDDNEMEFYDLDISNVGSTNDTDFDSSNIVPPKRFFLPQGNDMNYLHESGDNIPNSPSSDFDAIYGLDGRNSNHSTSFDYSQSGVSMRLLSEDGTLCTCNPIKCNPSSTSFSNFASNPRPDPSIEGIIIRGEEKSTLRTDVDHKQHLNDEPSSTIIIKPTDPRPPSDDPVSSSMSIDSRIHKELLNGTGIREKLSVATLSTTTPLPTTGSPALEYILALGSSVLSTPNKPFDETSLPDDKNGVESLGATESSVLESKNTKERKTSSSPERGERYTHATVSPDFSDNTKCPLKSNSGVSFSKRVSPKSVTNWSVSKTPSSLSSFDRDDGSSIEPSIQASFLPNESSNNSRLEYLKNRRKELESRFQNYRRNLSETMNYLSDSPSGSWSASREFSRSVSLYKNSDQSFSSPGVSSSNVVLDEGVPSSTCDIPSTASDCMKEGELSIVEASSEPERGKRRTRTPRVHKNYASLNDIEEILDNEESWRIETPEKDDEKQKVDDFLSSHSFKTEPEAVHFQSDTVIL